MPLMRLGGRGSSAYGDGQGLVKPNIMILKALGRRLATTIDVRLKPTGGRQARWIRRLLPPAADEVGAMLRGRGAARQRDDN